MRVAELYEVVHAAPNISSGSASLKPTRIQSGGMRDRFLAAPNRFDQACLDASN